MTTRKPKKPKKPKKGTPLWRTYESRARRFFGALPIPGCRAEKKEVSGVRMKHEVDVVVDFSRFGIRHRWLVECKHHRRRITKAMVQTLADTVADVGADRGFVLSEVGFQAGAIDCARRRNITLTSLSALKQGAEADTLDVRVADLQRRYANAQAAVFERIRKGRDPEPGTGAVYVTNAPGHGFYHVMGVLTISEHALKNGVGGHFPVTYPNPAGLTDVGVQDPAREVLRANSWTALLKGLETLIGEVEKWIAALPPPVRVSGVGQALAGALSRRRRRSG